MADNDERSPSENQAGTERKYAPIKQAVENAGFFVPQVTWEPDWNRIVCTSRHRQGFGYTGIIVFVTEAGGNWYLATPHPHHFRILDPAKAAGAVIAYLSQDRSRKRQTIGDPIDLQGKLVPIRHDEYNQALGWT